MSTTLSRVDYAVDSDGTNNLFALLRNLSSSNINSYYILYPVRYSKSLSGLTESEIYKTPFEEIMTSTLAQNNYTIKDNSTNLPSGIKLVATYTNTGNSNAIINGVLLRCKEYSTWYNLILTKFDKDITVAPTEAYQFTLNLDNLFQTFPSTIGS